jgi:hypothetical protein
MAGFWDYGYETLSFIRTGNFLALCHGSSQSCNLTADVDEFLNQKLNYLSGYNLCEGYFIKLSEVGSTMQTSTL